MLLLALPRLPCSALNSFRWDFVRPLSGWLVGAQSYRADPLSSSLAVVAVLPRLNPWVVCLTKSYAEGSPCEASRTCHAIEAGKLLRTNHGLDFYYNTSSIPFEVFGILERETHKGIFNNQYVEVLHSHPSPHRQCMLHPAAPQFVLTSFSSPVPSSCRCCWLSVESRCLNYSFYNKSIRNKPLSAGQS